MVIGASSISLSSIEIEADRARAILECLLKFFILDCVNKRFAPDDSGWRSLSEIAKSLGISTSLLYGRSKNQISSPIQELLRRNFVDRRFFLGERGRGGEVMRLRIAYENDVIKKFIKEETKDSGLSRILTNTAIKSIGITDSKLPRVPFDRRRIAVLPFVNFSQSASNEFFVDGMTEEVISSLSKVKGLKVIARTSVIEIEVLE